MTRLSTNARLSYNPGHRETPIEGIGGMYRFWKSIGSKDRDKLVELFEIGHKDPGEESPDTSRLDWQSLADQQKEAYVNNGTGPVELMSNGWDYAIDDALNHKVKTATDKLVSETRTGDDESGSFEDISQFSSTDSAPENERPYSRASVARQKYPDGRPSESAEEAKSGRAHSRAYDWRVSNDDRWRIPLLVDEEGHRLSWPTAPADNIEEDD